MLAFYSLTCLTCSLTTCLVFTESLPAGAKRDLRESLHFCQVAGFHPHGYPQGVSCAPVL